jgi:hypothetical protein
MTSEIISSFKEDTLCIIIVTQYMILSDCDGDITTLHIIEIISARLSSLHRVEENAHSSWIRLRCLLPIKYYTHKSVVRMVDTQILMPA